MRIAIYSRKSKFSDRGESIANQVTLCRRYCDAHFHQPEYLIYDGDEGFSGKNTHRPAFQRMMSDLRARQFDVLCCYRLDRISRSVSDFAALLDDLQRHQVAFVSLREQFDTSTPMGRAMVFVASTFAQLERETLAERVRDNLYELAKTGRWLGGTPPLGYKAEQRSAERCGKAHKFYALSPIPDELADVRTLYAQFIALGSLTKLRNYCHSHYITSRQGVAFSLTTLRQLLQNPVYAMADAESWRYFASGDFDLCAKEDDFDGTRGIQPFNRTCKVQEQTIGKPCRDWIITVGAHEGAVSGALWAKAQALLCENSARGAAYRAPRTEVALLSGLLRCSQCGAYMRPKVYGQPLENGMRRFHYLCTKKVESRGECCRCKNAPGIAVDLAVIHALGELSKRCGLFDEAHAIAMLADSSHQAQAQRSIQRYQQDISALEQRTQNLLNALSERNSEATRAPILQQLAELEAQLTQAKFLLSEATNAEASASPSPPLPHVLPLLIDFGNAFHARTHSAKRQLIRSLIAQIVWDGTGIQIHFAVPSDDRVAAMARQAYQP